MKHPQFCCYDVSESGVVVNSKTKNVMKPFRSPNGYLNLSITHEGIRITKGVHRLVAETFLPNSDCELQVNHRDGVKTNNNLENLEWCSPSENVRHAFRSLRKINGRQLLSVSDLKQIKSIYDAAGSPKRFIEHELSERYGVSCSTIRAIGYLAPSYRQRIEK